MSSINIRLKLNILNHEVKVEAPYENISWTCYAFDQWPLSSEKTLCSLTIVQYVTTFVINIVLVFLSLRATQFLKL